MIVSTREALMCWSCNPGLVQAYRLTDSDVTELLDTPEEDEYDYRSSCCLSCASLHSWSPVDRLLFCACSRPSSRPSFCTPKGPFCLLPRQNVKLKHRLLSHGEPLTREAAGWRNCENRPGHTTRLSIRRTSACAGICSKMICSSRASPVIPLRPQAWTLLVSILEIRAKTRCVFPKLN